MSRYIAMWHLYVAICPDISPCGTFMSRYIVICRHRAPRVAIYCLTARYGAIRHLYVAMRRDTSRYIAMWHLYVAIYHDTVRYGTFMSRYTALRRDMVRYGTFVSRYVTIYRHVAPYVAIYCLMSQCGAIWSNISPYGILYHDILTLSVALSWHTTLL